MKRISLMIAACLVACCACSKESGTPTFTKKQAAEEEPKEEQKDTTSTTPGTNTGSSKNIPVMGSCTVYSVNVPELSGLCLNKDKTALLACGDEGVVKQISFDGKTVTDIWSHDADMEDITIDPSTGDIWLAIEGAQKTYKVPAPGYNSYSTVFYVQEAVDKEYGNSGLEGISWYKDDIMFIGSQWGANLWQYKKDGTMVSKISLSGIMDEVAGLCYDAEADWLWVSDSDKKMIFIINVDGTLVKSYSVSQISNAESVCVDRANSCVWVGSDEDSPKLYKYNFTF